MAQLILLCGQSMSAYAKEEWGGGEGGNGREGDGRAYNLNRISMTKVLVLLLLLVQLQGKIIQVPPITNDGSLPLRLDQKSSIDSVYASFGNLSRIYKKEVREIVEGKEVDFPTCQEESPWADFWGTHYLPISNQVSHYGLVHNFEQVKYPRSLIDIATYKDNVYYLLQNGELHLVKSGAQGLREAKTHQTGEGKVNKGNFVVMAGSGLGVFINHNQAQLFSLTEDEFAYVVQYEQKKGFETAIPLEDDYFAAAFGEEGVVIYQANYKEKTLKVVAELNNDNAGSTSPLNIKDLAYDSRRNILFIADYNSQILSMQLIFSSNALTTRLTSSTIPKKQCTLVYYDGFNDELYLNCKALQKYRINNWPIIDEKVLPRQDISIREITSSGAVVALVGRDVFEVISSDRKAAVYEDKLMDKLIISEGQFISGNENGILLGYYQVYPPTMACSATDKSLLGTHRLLIKVVAECSQKYFTSVGFQPGAFSSDDKCVYSLYRNMMVWQPAAINTTPFMVIGVILGLLGLAIFVWWAFSYLNFRKLKNYFDNNYSNLQEEQHPSASDRKEGVASEGGVAGTNEKMEVPKGEQVGEQLHDIQ